MKDLNDFVTGNTLTAADFVIPMSEVQNVVEGTGQTLSAGDLDQLGKGIANYVANGDFYTDSGAAGAYVLTEIGSKQAPTAYTDGMRVRFEAANANTGASTVNVAGLGVKNIKLSGGTDPAAGDISGRTELVYDASNGWFELLDPVGLILSPEKSLWPSLSNAADADHDITFSAGRIIDSDGYQIINLLSSLTKQIDAAWAQGDAAGGLFSGTVATNTAYHCFVIVKDSDMSIDAGFDTDLNAANIPAGYTAYRRIHTVETDSSANIKGFTQSGDYIELSLQETIVNTTSPPTSSTNIQVVPVGTKKQARLRVLLSSSSSSVNAFIDSKFSNAATPALSTTSAATSATTVTFELLTDSLGEIQYRVTTGTITSFEINTLGWYDDRSE